MKKLALLFTFVFLACTSSAQDSKHSYKLLLTGASFASPNNGWFEMGCKQLNAEPMNKAVGSEAIATTANRIIDGSLYTKADLETIDAFVIMQVHNMDVADQSQLKEKLEDYKTPLDRGKYAAAFDYVIKRYISDCYNLKFDKNSKYYNTQMGKPAIIVLCTDWHDARTTYNNSVRTLATKWGFPVVEFDKNIGFSKNALHPVTGKQTTLMYAHDKQTIDGQEFGWHPIQGEHSYIQQRMAAIFADTMKRILPVK